MSSSSVVHQNSPETDAHLAEIYIKGKWIRVPALTVDDKTIVVRGSWLKTAVIRSEDWLPNELENPEACLNRLRERAAHGLRADLFTFVQKVPNNTPNYRYPFELDSIAVVHLTSFKEWWEGLPQESRKNVRRAQKRGVVVSLKPFDDNLIRELVTLNNDTPMRQGHRNDQYGSTFEQVKKDYSSFLDRSDCVGAYHENELIGFLKIVYRGDVASILNLLPNPRHSDKRPANAMLAKAMEICAEKGISYVVYGQFNYGNKKDSPLREFKERNGFGELLVPRYFVPLTLWGKVCMKARLHRGFLGILPHSVITLGNNLRSKWYNRK